MDLGTAMTIAQNVSSGTPAQLIAACICQMRMVDPWANSMSMPCTNWQAVIVERLLNEALFESLQAK